jgi:nitrous oxidase accessory protein NosD
LSSYRPGFAAILTSNADGRTLELAVLLIVVAISGIVQIRSAHAVLSLQPHVPIFIDGNSNFLPSNGVTSGHGTSLDPYVIEGWSIASQVAIEVNGTSAFFIIRNIETLGGSFGVYLRYANDGSVVNSTLNGTVRIDGSQNVTVSRNKIMNGQVLVSDTNLGPKSVNLLIANNTLVDSGIEIFSCPLCPQSPERMRVLGNTLISHPKISAFGGISVSAVGVTIADNIVAGSIGVDGSGITISNNTVNGIGIGAKATKVSGNIMTGGGIVLQGQQPQYDDPSYYDSQMIDASNLVNGRPVTYYNHCAGINVANVIVGQLIIASCSGVKIANLTVTNTSRGIFMAYVKQASLVDDHARSSGVGLLVYESSNVTVSNSDFAANENAINIDHSANLTLTGSTISGGLGLEVESSSDVRVSGNIIASGYEGVRAVKGANLILSGNRIKDNVLGVELHSPTHALVQGNWISGNQDYGIWVLSGNGLNITANTVISSQHGISFGIDDNGGYVYNAIVYHNNLVNSLVDQADHSQGIVPMWDNGYPSGGNYWSDYTGVDQCSGVNQNVCSGPDGIGDKPYTGIIQTTGSYPVQSSLVDHYPLMRPYGNVTQDVTVPSWPLGSTLVLTGVNSTSVSLHWSAATDDTWVSRYEISQDGRLVATVPGNLLSYTLSGLSPGATYLFKVDAGDPAGNLSTDGPSSSITLVENSSTNVVCSPVAVQVGASTTCTATATDPGYSGFGVVFFTSDGAGTFTGGLCTVGIGVSPTCSADYSPTAVGSGTHTITANYTGGTSHHTSSGTFTVTVTPIPPPFDYSLSNSGSVSITAGSSGHVTVTATLTAGSAMAVTMSCSGLPSGITCGTFTVNPVTPTLTGAASGLTVNVASSVVAGSYNFIVTSSPTGATASGATTTVAVTVAAPPAVPGPARTPGPTFFSAGWWAQNPIWMIMAGATAAAVAGATVLVRRRFAASRERQI